MLTQEQVLQAIQDKAWESDTIDGRDLARLSDFFPMEQWVHLGLKVSQNPELTPQLSPPPVSEWSEQKLIKQLASDVEFGFEKALDRRGLSASSMHCVVRMWLWILEDPLQHSEDYAQYGLPLLKAVAIKYGFPNPIGDDMGNEHRYSMDGDR